MRAVFIDASGFGAMRQGIGFGTAAIELNANQLGGCLNADVHHGVND